MVLALTTDDLQTIALVVIAVVVALGIVGALVMKAVVAKVISLVVMAVVAGAVWSQWASISDCVDKVKAQGVANVASGRTTTCSFFGVDVDIPTDQLPGG